jgi:hypothetical protein
MPIFKGGPPTSKGTGTGPVPGTESKPPGTRPVPGFKPSDPGSGPPVPGSKPPRNESKPKSPTDTFNTYLTNMFSSLNTKFTGDGAKSYIYYLQTELTDDITTLKDYLFKLKKESIVIFILMLSLFLHCKDKTIDDATYGKYYEYYNTELNNISSMTTEDTLYEYIMTFLYRQKQKEERSSSSSNV